MRARSSPKRLLNTAQKQLLAKTRRAGMTHEILASWQPEMNAFINVVPAFVETKDQTTEKVLVEDMFEKEHAQAIQHLMRAYGKSAVEAVAEVTQLNAMEARFLTRFYDGEVITGKLLRDNDTTINCMDVQAYYNAFDFLVNKKHVSKQDALAELAELTPAQLMMLSDFYHYGLRGEHIRQVKQNGKKYLAFDHYDDSASYRAYFKKVFLAENKKRDSVTDVFINTLLSCDFDIEDCETVSFFGRRTNAKLDFLHQHHRQGITPDCLPAHFTHQHEKTYSYLRFKGLSARDAALALKYLDENAASLLREYYQYGVRPKDLQAVSQQASALLRERIEYFVDLGMKRVVVFSMLADLNEWQAALLQDNYQYGMRRNDLLEFAKAFPDYEGFSDTQCQALTEMLKANKADRALAAMLKIKAMPEEEMANEMRNSLTSIVL